MEPSLDGASGYGSTEVHVEPVSWVGNEIEPGSTPVAEGPSPATSTRMVGRLRREASRRTDAGDGAHVPDPASTIIPEDRHGENLTFVASPTPLLPRLEFAPVQRTWARRPDFLHRVPGRFLLLGLIALCSLPFLWQTVLAPALGFGAEAAVEPTVVVPDEPGIELVIRDGGVHVDGAVPSVEVRDQVVDRLGEVLGPDVVIDELVIDPSAVVNLSAPTPLRLDDTVRFESGRSAIVDRYGALITTAADMLVTDADVSILLVGHADSIGAAEENVALSLERTESVRLALLDRGVIEDQIEVEARGESEPIASNEDADGRAINRRVEFFISGLLG